MYCSNWQAILTLYDQLIELEDSPIARLNRGIALAKVKGSALAIKELEALEQKSDIGMHYLFHATLGTFYKEENQEDKAAKRYEMAIALSPNKRDSDLLKKKLMTTVPN